MAGEKVTIDVDGAAIVVQFREIAVIKPTHDEQSNYAPAPYVPAAPLSRPANLSSTPASKPESLLRQALESRLLNDYATSRKGDTALFRIAYENNSTNPATAYWYARALIDNGEGAAASKVLEAHRKVIAATYSGQINRLDERIRHRVSLESLPARLVARIDKLIATGNLGTTSRRDRVPCYAVFRIQDQHGVRLSQSDFRIRCSGSEENLADFDDGYFLFTYERYRSSNSSPNKIEITTTGIKPKVIDFTGLSLDRSTKVEEYQVKRLNEADKLNVAAIVNDADGKPIKGATFRVQPQVSSGSSSQYPSSTTDVDGKASVEVFPGKYTATASAKGYVYARKSYELDASNDDKPLKFVLQKAILAKLRVAWKTTNVVGDSQETTSESVVTLNGATNSYRHDQQANWVTLRQVKDQPNLVINSQFQDGHPSGAQATWIRDISANNQPPSEARGEQSPNDQENLPDFTKIKFADIAKMKDRFPASSTEPPYTRGNPQALSLQVEQGQTFVGQLNWRNRQNGQPTTITFKIFVDSVSR